MSAKLILLSIIFFCCMGDREAWAESLPVASDYLTFEQNFDSYSTVPEMAAGTPRVVAVLGSVNFRKGLSGWALLCGNGGAKIRYFLKGNIDFGNPGTVAFWIFTDNWLEQFGEPRTLFFAIESRAGYIGFQTADGPKKLSSLEREITLKILYSQVLPDSYFSIPPLGVDGDNKWHLLAFAWSKNKIFMSIDGKPFSAKELKTDITEKAFPSDHFSIGSESYLNYLLDEFRIYSKKLSDSEISEIWKNGNEKLKQNLEEKRDDYFGQMCYNYTVYYISWECLWKRSCACHLSSSSTDENFSAYRRENRF